MDAVMTNLTYGNRCSNIVLFVVCKIKPGRFLFLWGDIPGTCQLNEF
jgi:hypothetical protein